VVAKIRNALVRRILRLLENMAKNKPDDYLTFYEAYGVVLKEGVAMDFENKNKIAQLLRFSSSLGEKLSDSVSLQEYVDRMHSDQKEIYFLAGESVEAVAQSPLLEAFSQRQLEVLFLGDPVDEWVVNSLQEFSGKKLKAIDSEDLDLGAKVKLEGVDAENKEETIELMDFLKKELAERVSDVKESNRLTDSPCAMVTPKGGMSLNMERLMKATDREYEATRRILEINPAHPIIRNMGAVMARSRDAAELKEWAHLLVDYVLIGEGTVENPQRVTRALQRVMSAATSQALKES
jgi:molecular chaperone HtpG